MIYRENNPLIFSHIYIWCKKANEQHILTLKDFNHSNLLGVSDFLYFELLIGLSRVLFLCDF